MDILSHTLSGLAIATVIASFSKGGFKKKAGIMLLGTFAGALPDLDAISMWSKFDGSIGKVFNLQHSGGVIYGSKFWYSHHAALHSLTFAALLPLLYILLSSFSKPTTYFNNVVNKLKNSKVMILTFFLGFTIHLLEDMPTPASVWGGVNLLWPTSTYYGGFGKIWWWNNYDIFLIILSVIVANLIVHAINSLRKIHLKKITTIIFLSGFILCIVQMNTRGFDFSYSGNTSRYHEFEQRSKNIQKEILGNSLYEIMLKFDNSLNLHF